MKAVFRFLKAWSAIVLITGPVGLFTTVLLLLGVPGTVCHRLVSRAWGKWILRGSGIALQVRGMEQIDLRRSYVFLYNHMSYFSFFAIAAAFPLQWRGILRKELLYIPFSWVFYRAGHIFLNLRDRSRAIQSIDKAAGCIRKGISVFIAPEGRRTGPSELAPFKSGGFILAIRAGVPVVPVTFLEDRLGTRPPWHFVPRLIRITVCEPIATTGLSLSDKDQLKEQVRTRILAAFEAEREAVGIGSSAASP
jgi:1-acyl-sn-glycerol-3-phosphate acyltransferase